MIQAAFHLGYLTSLFIVGFLADHFGAKRTYILAGIAVVREPVAVRPLRRRLLVGVLAARAHRPLPGRQLHAGAGAHQRPRRARAARARHGLSDRRVERRLRALPRGGRRGAHVHRLARRARPPSRACRSCPGCWTLCPEGDHERGPSASRRRVAARGDPRGVAQPARHAFDLGLYLPQLGAARSVGVAAGVSHRCAVAARAFRRERADVRRR